MQFHDYEPFLSTRSRAVPSVSNRASTLSSTFEESSITVGRTCNFTRTSFVLAYICEVKLK